MKVTARTRRVLAWRRQKRDLMAQGYWHLTEPCWEIVRGDRQKQIITDVQISTDGKSLYFRLGDTDKA